MQNIDLIYKHLKKFQNNAFISSQYYSLCFFKNNQTYHIGWVTKYTKNALLNQINEDFLVFYKEEKKILIKNISLLDISILLKENNFYTAFEELFDVHDKDGTIVGQVDRGLIPILGIEAYGVHLNGLVKKENTLFLWVAHRSLEKRLDPGKLDNIVGGGVSTHLTPFETLIKEAKEEASLPSSLISNAVEKKQIHYFLERPEGLRHDRLFCYDIILPEDFIPIPQDGEVSYFELLPLHKVFKMVLQTDFFKFNVNLVLIDLFLRNNLFSKKEKHILENIIKKF